MTQETGITIRPARQDEAPEILELLRIAMAVYAKNAGIGSLLDSQRETLDDMSRHILADHVLVAERNGHLVGTVRLVKGDHGIAYFSRFAVLPSHHLLGVGKLLYLEAEQYLQANSFTTIRLHTALANTQLVNFYTARGFDLIETKTTRGYPRGLFEKRLAKLQNQ